MSLLFAITLFVSALLLFLVEPMVAKMVLPLLGGTPAVWNTCMVFFQAALLAGYGYAHLSSTRLSPRRQALLQLTLLALPLLVLPLGVPRGWAPPTDANPIPWLLALLLITVGLPFFVLSSTAPLLQKWFAGTGHPSARDPYFLYAASNLGSMLALLAYPTLVEPSLHLKHDSWLSQSWFWAFGYGLFAVLMAGCTWAVLRSPASVPASGPGRRDLKATARKPGGLVPAPPADDPGPAAGPEWKTRLRWVALAFVPSSLMLGVTTYITLDIAAIPLLWVIPLALYLLSFIIVFAKWPLAAQQTVSVLMPLLVLILVFTWVADPDISVPIATRIALHLLTLFVVALVCHGELALTRPAPRYLTGFYLWLSLGGVLGGLFNALVAPLVFRSVLEYQIAMVCACLLLPQLGEAVPAWLDRRFRPGLARAVSLGLDVGLGLLLGAVAYGFMQYLTAEDLPPSSWLAAVQDGLLRGIYWLSVHTPERFPLGYGPLLHLLLYGLPVLIAYSYVARPLRFGLAVGALLVAGSYFHRQQLTLQQTIHQERSFFGVLKVDQVTRGTALYHKLIHGTTLHGEQSLDPARRREPLTYYDQTGPIGQLFAAFSGPRRKERLAFIGLGSGTLACYADRGQAITFYEIDRAVKAIAQNPAYFTFWSDCPAAKQIIMGDARLKLREAPAHHYGMLIVDAFSSDAIPVHLLTREAFQLYLDKLEAHGLLVVHISNRHLDLRPVVANLAHDLGLACIRQDDPEDRARPEKAGSNWVLLAREENDFGKLTEDISATPDSDEGAADKKRWRRLLPDPKQRLWTDDYSNILSVFMW